MEAICNPLAERGCEDILQVTQPRFEGNLNFSPLSPRISGLDGMTERAVRLDTAPALQNPPM